MLDENCRPQKANHGQTNDQSSDPTFLKKNPSLYRSNKSLFMIAAQWIFKKPKQKGACYVIAYLFFNHHHLIK